MRKSILMCLVMLGTVTAVVSAATMSLTELPVTNPGTRNNGQVLQFHVQGITDDGQYVVGTKDLAGVPDGVLIIRVSDLATTVYNDRGQMAGRGIAQAPGGLVVAGSVGSNANLGIHYNAGSSSGSYQLLNTGTGSSSQVAVQNALSLDPSTGDGYLVGSRYNNNQALAWKVTGGVVDPTAIWQRAYNLDTDLNGVSNDGIAVGTGGGGNTPILANVAINGLPSEIPAFPNQSTLKGQGNGISADHMYATGYMANLLNTDDSLHAFRYTYGVATEELLPAGGDIAALVQQSNGFDAANTGLVVGFTWNGLYADQSVFSGYRATVWMPGSTTGVLLEDILAANGVSLGDFAYLERCVSVTADGTTIAGRGVLTSDGSYRGFVVTIPEPATVGFLALGGLAMLRRRR